MLTQTQLLASDFTFYRSVTLNGVTSHSHHHDHLTPMLAGSELCFCSALHSTYAQLTVCTIVRVFVRSRAGDWQQHPGHGRGLSRLDGPRPQQEILGLHSTQLTNKSQLIPNYSLFNSLIKSGLKHLLDIQNNKLGVRFIGNILSISAFLLIFI